jgi:hypothetical protein
VKLKDRTRFFSFFREASVWIKEHVGETRSTVGTRRYFVKSHLKPNSNYNHQDEIIKWLAFWISTFPRCNVTKQFSIQWFSASHLSKWAWNKGCNWHWKVCFVHKDGQLRTINAKLYHKSNDFTFLIVNSPSNSSNIPAALMYEVSIHNAYLFNYMVCAR